MKRPKYFYWISSVDLKPPVNRNNCFNGALNIDILLGQTREKARAAIKGCKGYKLCQFERTPPYRFVKEVR